MKKPWTLAGIGMLTLLLGVPVGSFAQEPEKPKQEEPKPEPRPEGRPEPRPEQANPPRHEEEKSPKHEDSKHQSEAAKPQEHAGNARINRPAKTVRIPEEKFRAQFGRPHTFVVNRPVVVEGQPRFQYAGFWFLIADPWPVGWLYTDDCYIDFIDGDYFLFDVVHPEVRVLVFVVAA